jgi:hypothetical protein
MIHQSRNLQASVWNGFLQESRGFHMGFASFTFECGHWIA